MLTLQQVQYSISRHKAAMEASRRPGAAPSIEESRWAFLVTPDELSSLVDELRSAETISPVEPMSDDIANKMKEGRVLLHLDGTAIMPELMAEVPEEPLNG